MPSSTSSSERHANDPYAYEDRPVPELAWPKALILGFVLMVMGIAGWEYNARVIWGYETGHYIDNAGLWAQERRKVDRGEAEIAVIGASRIFFDLDLDTYERMTGVRPIMLARVGTNPRPFLTDLANDEDFKGLLIVGITPNSFFRDGVGLFADSIQYYKDESPSQWMGQQLSMVLEPLFAFYDNKVFPLFALIEEIPIDNPAGVKPPASPIWQLSYSDSDRNSKMFWKVEELDYYQTHAQMTWRKFLQAADKKGTPKSFDIDAYLASVVKDVEKIRARGGDVVFVRPPSSGDYRPQERKYQARQTHWDKLLRETRSVGVHFEDHPELQGFRIPEWSHLHSEDAAPFTAALVPILNAKIEDAGRHSGTK